MDFKEELERLLNRCSQENASNTPDFVLAEFLSSCLSAWNEGIRQRETWYGRRTDPIQTARLLKSGLLILWRRYGHLISIPSTQGRSFTTKEQHELREVVGALRAMGELEDSDAG